MAQPRSCTARSGRRRSSRRRAPRVLVGGYAGQSEDVSERCRRIVSWRSGRQRPAVITSGYAFEEYCGCGDDRVSWRRYREMRRAIAGPDDVPPPARRAGREELRSYGPATSALRPAALARRGGVCAAVRGRPQSQCECGSARGAAPRRSPKRRGPSLLPRAVLPCRSPQDVRGRFAGCRCSSLGVRGELSAWRCPHPLTGTAARPQSPNTFIAQVRPGRSRWQCQNGLPAILVLGVCMDLLRRLLRSAGVRESVRARLVPHPLLWRMRQFQNLSRYHTLGLLPFDWCTRGRQGSLLSSQQLRRQRYRWSASFRGAL